MAEGARPAPHFVHLHVHTEYSLLDGACRIRDLIAACRRMNMPAVAITDHGNLFGAIEFYSAAKEAGIHPIIGCELYLAPGDRRERQAVTTGNGPRETAYHQLLLAMDEEGYRNLMRLVSIGYLEGFYYKPRIDMQTLREYSAGLVCTSTCLAGAIPQDLLRRDAAAARRRAEQFLEIFGPERFFIELQNHGLPDQQLINPELAELARRLGVGLIASNDVHYLTHDDVEAHDVLCCISTRSRIGEANRLRFGSDQFYLKSPQEMAEVLPEYREALENTLRVAAMCRLELDFSRRYAPVFRTPAGRTAEQYLRELVHEGARRRYTHIDEELRERIDYELSVICARGLAGYFLIVWDFVRWAHEHDIPAVARGSGCSTVVGYCLGISAVDPIRYGLYFERFMDPERDEMPDIDVDICQDRRQEVIDYVREKYGHVAQIITFGRLKPRAVIRDVCRALEVPLAEADRLARLVPEEQKMTIDQALVQEPELQRLYQHDERVRRVLDLSRRLEGLARHASVHAAGVVIADRPLETLVPLYRPADSREVTTQFEGPTVERVGLLKMDLLGLRTLSQIHLARRLVERHHGVRVDLDRLDLSDARVYELLGRGETRGVFQFESGGMRDVLMKMKPNRIEDLIAANALFRPGPMAYIDEYIARKHGRTKWSTPHPLMTEVLAETYGIMVYQEQVSRLVHRLGGVPLRRAFRLAKAISKKKESMFDAERAPFLEGCQERGLRREVAEQIFADILKFGGYAFNKAHSTQYAVLAFQTAWLKTYYPVEFMAALLTYESTSTEKVAEYIDECRRIHQADGSLGIPVLPPDVNESEEAFTIVYEKPAGPEAPKRPDAPLPAGRAEYQTPGPVPGEPARKRGSIRFGLTAISGVGQKAAQAILEARQAGGPFQDMFEFCERVDLTTVNKAVIEALIKAGAFDTTGAMRRALMEVLEKAIELGQEAQRHRRAGQLDMFGDFRSSTPRPTPLLPACEWPDAEMLAYEKATLGFYITRHPLTQHAELVQRLGTADSAALRHLGDGQRVVLGGLVSKVRSVPLRNPRGNGRKLIVAVIEDFAGSVEATLFPDRLPELAPRLRPDAVVFVVGSVDRRREQPGIRISDVVPVERAVRELAQHVLIRLPGAGGPFEKLAAVRELCAAHRGRVELLVRVESPEGWSAVLRGRGVGPVDPSAEFLFQMQVLVGEENVLCQGARGPIRPGDVWLS